MGRPKRLAGKYVSRSRAVHAGFEKFCIPGREYRKREFSGPQAVFKNKGTPILLVRTTQNAGCMMAIHANCTKTKIGLFFKLLIYNDIFDKQ
ncbi:hypothetical protein [Pseudomonas sp.]|uniref:hypothetical protein n=1 Tax=Pseudomonas sp. TaxID=306 RepID=UPI003C42589E